MLLTSHFSLLISANTFTLSIYINRVNERHVPVREHIHLERSVRLVVFLHDGQTVPLISVDISKCIEASGMDLCAELVGSDSAPFDGKRQAF